MSDADYQRTRVARLTKYLDEAECEMKQMRRTIWALFALLLLMGFALGVVLAHLNFGAR